MKTLTKWILAALASVAMVGCDPFEEAVTGPLAVISAGFTETAHGTAVEGTGSGSTWTISGVPSVCVGPGQAEVEGFVFVKFNKLLDGGSVQADVNDCTPAGTPEWLTVTPAAPALGKWYSCYNPQSPTPDEGASVIIFLGASAPVPSGWGSAAPIPASGDAVTTITASGSVFDKEGQAASIDVTVEIDPDPGLPGTPAFANVTATTVDVSWTAPCATVTSYELQRAPDVAGAPGTWAAVTTTAGTTFTDTGLTTATTYWYRVVATTAGGALTSAEDSVTTL